MGRPKKKKRSERACLEGHLITPHVQFPRAWKVEVTWVDVSPGVFGTFFSIGEPSLVARRRTRELRVAPRDPRVLVETVGTGLPL